MTELHAGTAIAYRDLLKFLRDPVRIASTFVFPVVFVLLLGGSLQNTVDVPYDDFRTFVFLGVLGQTMFQSASMGIVSLIEDRENDFSQEIFVAPISRYTIVGGKIGGEALVALAQGMVILVFGTVIGVSMTLEQIAGLAPAAVAVCLAGGAFGLLLMSNLNSQRAANQVFPFIMLPQYFLAGVFNIVEEMPLYLKVPSLFAPMRYAVDLVRGIYYPPEALGSKVVLATPILNYVVLAITFALFTAIGTALFVRKERNR